jgi:hypothetical protein
MTTTDLAAGRRAVARKKPANSPAKKQQVIDGQWQHTRNHRAEGIKGIALLLMAFLLLGLIVSLTAYHG